MSGEEGTVRSRATQVLQAGIPRFNNANMDWPETHAKRIVIKQSVAGAEKLLHTMHVGIKGKSVNKYVIFCPELY